MSIQCLIFTILTVLIPAKLTYLALKGEHKEEQLKLWSHYWAFFVLLQILQCYLPFLTYQPFQIAILLFQLWLYVQNYKGALLLSELGKQKLVAFGIEEHVKKISEILKVARVFDSFGPLSPADVNLKSE